MKLQTAIFLFSFCCATIAAGSEPLGADSEWMGYGGAPWAETLDSTAIERQGGAPQPKGCAIGWEWSIEGGIAHCVVSSFISNSVAPAAASVSEPIAYPSASPTGTQSAAELTPNSGSWCPNLDCVDHTLLIIDPWSPFGYLDPDFQPWYASHN